MAAQHVRDHGSFTSQTASASDTVALAADVAPGNFLVVVCFHSSGGVLTVTDAVGNPWTTRVIAANGTNPEMSIAAAKVRTGMTAGQLITAAYTLNPTYKQIHVMEFSGVDEILDIATPPAATGTGTAPSAPGTTLTAGDLLVGGVNWNLTSPATDVTAVGSGWTESFATQDTFTTIHHLSSFWKIGGTPGSENIGGTLPGSAPWATAFVAFKATPPGITLRSKSAANIGTTRSTSITLAAPAGIQNGDVLVAVVQCNNNTENFTAPAGWTAVPGLNPFHDAASSTICVFTKVASNESGSYTFTDTTGTTRSICAWMGCYVGVDTSNVLDVPANTSTSGTVTSLTTTKPGCLLMVGGSYSGAAGGTATFTPTGAFIEEVDQHTASGSTENSQAVDDLTWTGSGNTGSFVVSGSTTPTGAFALALRPLSASTVSPVADISVGGWINNAGTQTSLYQSLDEAAPDDNDAVESSLNPNGDIVEVKLGTFTP